DRTEYLLGTIKTNPAFAIIKILKKLQDVGATIAGIPCNTAHSKEIFGLIKNELKANKLSIKLLNMIEETVMYISNNYPNITKVGVLSTTGTYKSEVYNKSLKLNGYKVIIPTIEMQKNIIHPAIYHPKYGIKSTANAIHPKAKESLLQGALYLKNQGAEVVILGCTEIPLAITEEKIYNMITIDPTNILARSLIKQSTPDKLKPI
ncbi:MAG: aspartate/glutamate racemase family protein, partial [Methanosarcinales archaeon]|nr:aspartate/glutamate racemase family protein [Methanosarcinales archaeon]